MPVVQLLKILFEAFKLFFIIHPSSYSNSNMCARKRFEPQYKVTDCTITNDARHVSWHSLLSRWFLSNSSYWIPLDQVCKMWCLKNRQNPCLHINNSICFKMMQNKKPQLHFQIAFNAYLFGKSVLRLWWWLAYVEMTDAPD